MANSSSPSALLQAHLAACPEDPWLFWRQGWDWRWLSWRETALRVARIRAALAGLEVGTPVAFEGRPGTAAVLFDLAVRGTGLLSLPLTGSSEQVAAALVAQPCRLWLEAEGSSGAPALPDQVERRRLAVAPGEVWRRETAAVPDPMPLAAAGGAVVDGPDGPVKLAAGRLAATSRAVDRDLGHPERRDVTLLARPLGDPAARGLVDWALLAAAAVVLEPDPPALAATAAWARPTVLAGGAADLALLRGYLEATEKPRHRRRLPLGRLRAWLLAPGEAPPPAEEAFWRDRGVALVAVPSAADPAPPDGGTPQSGMV